MVVVHATLTLDPETREEAIEHIRSLVETSNEEPGVIDYRAGIDVQDEHTVSFLEHYEDDAAFHAHLQTEHYQAFEDRLPDYLADKPEVMKFEISEAYEPTFE